MEEKQVIIITTTTELERVLSNLYNELNQETKNDFENDKLTRKEAAKLAGVSLPTLAKMVRAKIFSVHGFGRKQFLYRSEIIAGLRKNINE